MYQLIKYEYACSLLQNTALQFKKQKLQRLWEGKKKPTLGFQNTSRFTLVSLLFVVLKLYWSPT